MALCTLRVFASAVAGPSCLLDSFFMDSLEEVANRRTNSYVSTLNANDDEEKYIDITTEESTEVTYFKWQSTHMPI